MTKAVLDGFRRQLIALAKRIRGGTEQMRDEMPPRAADGELGAGPAEVPIDPTELAAHLSEEEVVQTIVAGEERLLGEINAAIDRIDRGTFGRCETCQKPIARERLRAVPYARCCIGCSGLQEINSVG